MSWINVILGIVIINTITGTSAFLVVRVFAAAAVRRGAMRAVYPYYRIVQVFYIVPGFVVCAAVGLRGKHDFGTAGAYVRIILCAAFAVWLAGLCVTLFGYIREYRSLLWLRRNDVPVVEGRCRELIRSYAPKLRVDRISIYTNFLLKSPCVIGVFRPEILLPEVDYTEEELSVILMHETAHITGRDNLVKRIALIFAVVHWFVPLASAYLRELDEWAETACDIRVCRRFFDSGVKKYFQVLYRVYIKSCNLVTSNNVRFCRSDSLRGRIERIRKWNRK